MFLASRAGVRGLHGEHEERAHIDAALKRLGRGAAPGAAEMRLRQSDWPPPGSDRGSG